MNLFYFSYSWNNFRGEQHRAFTYVGVDGEVSRDVIEQAIVKIWAENEGVVPHTVVIDFIYKLTD